MNESDSHCKYYCVRNSIKEKLDMSSLNFITKKKTDKLKLSFICIESSYSHKLLFLCSFLNYFFFLFTTARHTHTHKLKENRICWEISIGVPIFFSFFSAVDIFLIFTRKSKDTGSKEKCLSVERITVLVSLI